MPVVQMPDGALVEMPENPTPEELSALEGIINPKPMKSPLAARVGASAWRGILGIPEFFAKGAAALSPAAIEGYMDPRFKDQRHYAGEFADLITKTRDLAPKDDTALGHIVEGASGGVLAPGGLVGNAFSGGLAGLGGYLGGKVTDNNPLGEGLGAILGGVGGALARKSFTNTPELAREVMEGVDPTHLKMAQDNMTWAQSQGVPINASQAMPRASNIDDMIEALSDSRFGDKTISTLRNQPEQLHVQGRMAESKIPGTAISMPKAADEMQESATRTIRASQDESRAAFAAAIPEGTRIPAAALRRFDGQLSNYIKANPNSHAEELAKAVRSALKTAKKEGAPPPFYPPQPAKRSSPESWITDARQLSQALDTVLADFGASKLTEPASQSARHSAANAVRAIFERTVATPDSPLGLAKKAADRVTNAKTIPLRKSVTGRIAGLSGAMDDREAAAGKLLQVFERGTPSSGRSEILALQRDTDPEVFTNAVKTYIAEKLQKLQPTLPGGRVDQNMARNIKDSLASNPMQVQGLKDMLAGVARANGMPEDEVVNGFMNFIKLSDMAARRPNRISGLPRNDIKEVAQESATADTMHGPFGILARQGTKIRMRLNAEAYRTMDELLSTPEGLDTLRKLAKKPVMSAQAANIVASFYGGVTSGSGDESPGVIKE
jgi:hypothetical protein